jgi:trigger factor
MDVKFDKTDNVNAVLTISFKEEDYQQDVKKSLSEIGRERPLKGFRPGHVPAALLQKHFGTQVLADVIDKKVSKALTDYIINNKVDILGEPMLSSDTKVNFNTDKDFAFKFELGLAPEFDLKLDKSIKIPYYNIEVSQDMLDKQCEANKKRFGKQVPGDVAAEDSLLRGSLVELNEDGSEKADGIKVEKTIISPQYLKNDDEKKKFIGKKVNDEVVFNPNKAADGNVAELASMLNVDKEKADVKSDFKLTIGEILVNQDAEVNQELFDNVLGKDVAKTEEEYIAKLKEMMGNQLKNDSNYRFTIDVEQVLKDKVGTLELPDAFLKKFIVARNKDVDASKIDDEYAKTASQLQWQLIKEKAAKELDVKVEVEDKLRLARYFAAQQFAQYGMSNLPDEVIDKYAHEILEKKEYSNDIENRAFEDKVFAAIKNVVALDEKSISVDDFNKLFEAQK